MKFFKLLNNKKLKFLENLENTQLIDADVNIHFNKYFQIPRDYLYYEIDMGLSKMQKYYKYQDKKVKNFEKICIAIIQDGYLYLKKNVNNKGYFEYLYFEKGTKNFTEIYDLVSQYYNHLYKGENFKQNLKKNLTDVIPVRIKTKSIKNISQYKDIDNTLVFVCCDRYKNNITIPEDYIKIPIWYFNNELCNYEDNSITVNIIIEILNFSYIDFTDYLNRFMKKI